MTYSEKLKDPRWQKKRLEVFEHDKWICQGCGATTKTLHVHHWSYKKDAEPWDYDLEELSTLCEDCHEDETLCRADAESDLLAVLKYRKWTAESIRGLCNLISVDEVSGTRIREMLEERNRQFAVSGSD